MAKALIDMQALFAAIERAVLFLALNNAAFKSFEYFHLNL